MNIVIIFSIAVVIAIVFCSLLVKKNKKLKTDIEGFKLEIANLRKEKDTVQMKNYELSQLVEEFQIAQKKAVEVKKKAEKAKKQTEAKSEKLKTNSTDRVSTAVSILSKPKKTTRSKN